jgi:nitrate reductase gamma subunit
MIFEPGLLTAAIAPQQTRKRYMQSICILLMKKFSKSIELSLLSLLFTLLISHPAMAYVGPGAGLLAIAAFIALAVAVLAALLGFLWFPLKRLLRKRNQNISNESQATGETEE